MSRSQQHVGSQGEDLAERELTKLGVRMVEEIGTPVSLIPHPTIPGYFRVIFRKKVSGDHNGIMPDGRRVLIECKTVLDDNLSWSHLREHQPERLTENADNHGLSLLVWVHNSGVYVMEWEEARERFGPGKPMKPHVAAIIDDTTRALLQDYAVADRRK